MPQAHHVVSSCLMKAEATKQTVGSADVDSAGHVHLPLLGVAVQGPSASRVQQLHRDASSKQGPSYFGKDVEQKAGGHRHVGVVEPLCQTHHRTHRAFVVARDQEPVMCAVRKEAVGQEVSASLRIESVPSVSTLLMRGEIQWQGIFDIPFVLHETDGQHGSILLVSFRRSRIGVTM